MEIPLKSQPKVSTVNLLDESKFQIDNNNNNTSDQSGNHRDPSQVALEGLQPQQHEDDHYHHHNNNLIHTNVMRINLAWSF